MIIANVVFGGDTTIFGKGVVKIWTVFGTKLGFWKHIAGYSEADAFTLFRMYRPGHIAKNLLRLFVTIPSVIIRAGRMSKPWNWLSLNGIWMFRSARSERNLTSS